MEETRCTQCSCIRISHRLEYYPIFYCKLNGQEINFDSENGWDRMSWCPMKEEKNDA